MLEDKNVLSLESHARKKNSKLKIQIPKFSNSTSVTFWGSVGPKNFGNMLLVTDVSMQKSMWNNCGITSFKEQKQCLE